MTRNIAQHVRITWVRIPGGNEKMTTLVRRSRLCILTDERLVLTTNVGQRHNCTVLCSFHFMCACSNQRWASSDPPPRYLLDYMFNYII